MKTYIIDKYDYKKYLLSELPDTRQEDLIFWKKTIPMPVDLVYEIFEKRGELFSLYLHHIGAVVLYACSAMPWKKTEGTGSMNWLDNLQRKIANSTLN